MHETFVFYFNPKSKIKTITRKKSNNDEKYFIIGHFVSDQNNGKYPIAGIICYKEGNIIQGYFDKNTKIYHRVIFQNGDSFEGKRERIMNNDGTVSYDYEQGVNKYSDGALHEGKRINGLWNGKVNFKWEEGDKQVSEMLNDEKHGPIIVYDFDGKVKMGFCSDG